MKNYFSVWQFALAMIAIQSSSALAGSVSILADPWCPYTCEDVQKKPGFLIEVSQAALAGTEHKVEYKIMPWARALDEVRKGTAHGAAGATETDKEGMVFSPSFGDSQTCFYAKPDLAWKYEGPESLAKVSLGAIVGYTYSDIDAYIEKNKSNADKVQLLGGDSPLPQSLKKLEAGRVQVFVEDKNVVDYFYANQGKKNPFEAKGCLPASAVYVAFGEKNKDTAAITKALNDGYKKIQASGDLKKILDKYGLK